MIRSVIGAFNHEFNRTRLVVEVVSHPADHQPVSQREFRELLLVFVEQPLLAYLANAKRSLASPQ